jgi:predicted phage tail protein
MLLRTYAAHALKEVSPLVAYNHAGNYSDLMPHGAPVVAGGAAQIINKKSLNQEKKARPDATRRTSGGVRRLSLK